MKIVPCTQLTSAWFQAHCGVISGSHMSSVLDYTQKGVAGSKRKTYLRTKLAELVTGIAIQDNYVSKEMLEGIEMEPQARAAYEMEEGVMVDTMGFALHDDIPRFGGSFDGLVGDDGLLEIKCGKAGTHLQWILDGCVPEEHLPQINSYLSISGRAYCDFVSYCAMVPRPLRLMIIRHERDEIEIAIIEDQVRRFNAELDAAVERLRSIVGDFDLPAQMEPAAPRKSPIESQLEATLGWLDEEDLAILDRKGNQ